jgi:membrane protease YdiL (CAAX protease family)
MRLNVLSSPMPWDIWLIFFVLAVVVPWRGRARLQQLLAKPRVEGRERLSLYASTIAFQWIAVAVSAWRAWAHGFSRFELGLTARALLLIMVLTVLGTLLLATFQWANLRRIGRTGSPARSRLLPLAERILPQSPRELTLFFVLAVTAGLCEEFLYRGFAMAAFWRAGLPGWATVAVSAALFGLAHLYQGRGGFVSTMILGLLFGGVRLACHSLIPVMAWHTAVDIVAGVAGPRFLLRHAIPATEAEARV